MGAMKTLNVCAICKAQWDKASEAKRAKVLKLIAYRKTNNPHVCVVCGDLKETTIEVPT
jgi:hypothetical protein